MQRIGGREYPALPWRECALSTPVSNPGVCWRQDSAPPRNGRGWGKGCLELRSRLDGPKSGSLGGSVRGHWSLTNRTVERLWVSIFPDRKRETLTMGLGYRSCLRAPGVSVPRLLVRPSTDAYRGRARVTQ